MTIHPLGIIVGSIVVAAAWEFLAFLWNAPRRRDTRREVFVAEKKLNAMQMKQLGFDVHAPAQFEHNPRLPVLRDTAWNRVLKEFRSNRESQQQHFVKGAPQR
jgi:hypothetical protein